MESSLAKLIDRLSSPTTLTRVIEEAIGNALSTDQWAWHRCLKKQWENVLLGTPSSTPLPDDLRWLFYRKDQQHIDQLATIAHPHWQTIQVSRSSWPEGFWYALEASIDRKCLFVIYGNRFNGPAAMNIQTGAVIDLVYLAYAMLTDENALSPLIQRIVKAYPPNFHSKT